MTSRPRCAGGAVGRRWGRPEWLAVASVAIRSLAPMLGRSLDDIHPYGIRVATGGRGEPSPEFVRAAEKAARKADRLMEQFLDETSTAAMRRRHQNGARRANAKRQSKRAT